MKDRIVNLKIMNSKNRFLFWWEIKLLLSKKISQILPEIELVFHLPRYKDATTHTPTSQYQTE